MTCISRLHFAREKAERQLNECLDDDTRSFLTKISMELSQTLHFALTKTIRVLPLVQHQVISNGYFKWFQRRDGRKELTAFRINPICATTIVGKTKMPRWKLEFGSEDISTSSCRPPRKTTTQWNHWTFQMKRQSSNQTGARQADAEPTLQPAWNITGQT